MFEGWKDASVGTSSCLVQDPEPIVEGENCPLTSACTPEHMQPLPPKINGEQSLLYTHMGTQVQNSGTNVETSLQSWGSGEETRRLLGLLAATVGKRSVGYCVSGIRRM